MALTKGLRASFAAASPRSRSAEDPVPAAARQARAGRGAEDAVPAAADPASRTAGTQPAPAFRTALKPLQLTASVLLVVGMVWFFLRLKG